MNLAKTVRVACLAALFAVSTAFGAEWKTDFQAAKADAKKESKLLFLDFTGSDWCPPCKQMKADTLEKPEFLEFAGKQLVLVEVDFPRRKSQTAAQKKANQELATKFNIEGYPTFVLVDADGKELGRHVGYLRGGPDALMAKIKEWQKAK
ncbi:MAG: thioredoxin family protein [Verrucomicrobiales bacterium]|nr:thioredoxin family protein [Verrucomicrobiales bacterium]